jgi:glycosyltransferase involved in cell wall biosynthesis
MTAASKKNAPIVVSDSGKPRVLVVGPHPSQIGGVATFLGILLSSEILRQNYKLIHLDTSRSEQGIGVAGKFAPINLVYFMRQYTRFLQVSLQSKPQIMHIPINMSWAFWKEAAFILLAQKLGMKVVAHLHEGAFDKYYLKCSTFVRWLIGRVLHHADVVIALSNRWKDFLLKEVSSDLNIEVVPNTVDPLFASAIHKAEMENSEKIVLYVGGLGYKKGVFDILKAVPIVVSYFRDAHFFFAGSPENRSVREDLRQISAEGNLNGHIEFLGVVTGQEKLALFQKATLFVFPSYADNLPYALLEAMSVGLPVITTPVGSIPEIVQDGKNGFLIEPGDYKALAERIIKLLRNSALRQEMAFSNTKLIQNSYLPETASRRFDQIYSKLVSVG